MLKNFLGAFVGSRMQARAGHPVAGAVVGAAAMSLARRSLPLAVGLAVGVAALDLITRKRARPRALPARRSGAASSGL